MRSANSAMEKRCSASLQVAPALKIGPWKPETVDLLNAVKILTGLFMFRRWVSYTRKELCV